MDVPDYALNVSQYAPIIYLSCPHYFHTISYYVRITFLVCSYYVPIRFLSYPHCFPLYSHYFPQCFPLCLQYFHIVALLLSKYFLFVLNSSRLCSYHALIILIVFPHQYPISPSLFPHYVPIISLGISLCCSDQVPINFIVLPRYGLIISLSVPYQFPLQFLF